MNNRAKRPHRSVPSRRKALIHSVLVAGLLAFVLPLAVYATEPTPVSITLPATVFTNPQTIVDGGSDPVIRDTLIDLIDAATEGSTVDFMIYLFADTELQTALKAAYSRGVEVNVIIDWSKGRSGRTTNGPAYEDLEGKVTSITKVDNPLGIVHNKIALFSEVATTEGNLSHVMFVTSSNFKGSSYGKFQDAVIFQDELLFTDGFLAYWDYIIEHNSSSGLKAYDYRNQKGSVALDNGKKRHKAYFFPKRKNGKKYGHDTAALTLANVIEGYDSSGTGATVRLAM